MWSRRAFLRTTGALGTATFALESSGLEEIAAASAAVSDQAPDIVAKDEFYWREIQQAFDLDRTLISEVLAAAGRARGERHEHPQVRGNRHVADGAETVRDSEGAMSP